MEIITRDDVLNAINVVNDYLSAACRTCRNSSCDCCGAITARMAISEVEKHVKSGVLPLKVRDTDREFKSQEYERKIPKGYIELTSAYKADSQYLIRVKDITDVVEGETCTRIYREGDSDDFAFAAGESYAVVVQKMVEALNTQGKE